MQPVSQRARQAHELDTVISGRGQACAREPCHADTSFYFACPTRDRTHHPGPSGHTVISNPGKPICACTPSVGFVNVLKH